MIIRSEEARASIRKAIFIIILTIFIAIAIAIASFILIIKDITKSEQIKKQLALSNNQLEESMEELATREEQLRDFNLQLESKIEERTRELAASEQHYRFMAESIPAIVWMPTLIAT